jgi:hypothetical protein
MTDPIAIASGRRDRFLTVAVIALVATTAVLTIASLVLNDGHFLYVFDDTAIHMSMARQLVEHGTWGVAAHHYASASSSPGWTLVLSAFTFALPFARDALPLVLNVAAAIWVLLLIKRNQTFLSGSGRDRVAAAVTVLAVTVLWFLPALVLEGMEHILHAALVLLVLVAFDRILRSPFSRRGALVMFALVALATTVRFETAFVAVGIAMAGMAAAGPRFGRDTRANLTRVQAVFLGLGAMAAAALPLAITAIVNRAFGEGNLPNSILAKTGQDRLFGLVRDPRALIDLLASDPALLTLIVLVVAYLAWAAFDGPQQNAALAIVFVVAALLQAGVADLGWLDRYQAYLLIAGSLITLRIASEVVAPAQRTRLLWVILVLIPVLAINKVVLLGEVPLAMSNTYRQREQVARFLHQYYDGRAFLTGELGYSTLLHNGPVVDILGLGTYPVARARHDGTQVLGADFVSGLARKQHVRIAAIYTINPGIVIPADWTLVAQWHLDEPRISIPDSDITFYAPKGAATRELTRHLHEFQSELPSRVSVVYRDELRRRFLAGQQSGG